MARKRPRESVSPKPAIPTIDGAQVEVVDRTAVPMPPRIRQPYTRVPLPQRPNFIYSEEKEKALKNAEIEKLLPPFVEKNLDAGWYSVRQYSMDYYQRLVPPMTPYLSIRCPHATQDIYGTWSPYIMRRLQDQFNFTLDHLTWLQKLLLDWRVPLSKPLEDHELRPLADDVELAVLKSLTGHVLQPNNFFERIRNRVVFEYDDQGRERKKRPKFETIVYEEDEQSSFGKGDYTRESSPPPQKFVRERRPSASSMGSVPSTQHVITARSLLSPTPSDDEEKSNSSKCANSTEKAVAQRAMLVLIDQVLQTAKDSKVANPILHLILSFHNARSILFALATKQPAILQQLVMVMKNPNLKVPPETLAQLEKKLRDVASECND